MCIRFGPAPQELNTVGGVKVVQHDDHDEELLSSPRSSEVSALLTPVPELRENDSADAV